MSSDSVVIIAAVLAAIGVFLIFITLSAPGPVRNARSLSNRERVQPLQGLPAEQPLMLLAQDLASVIIAFMGVDSVADENSAPARTIVQRLKCADWFWEAGVADKPTHTAPFWDMPSYWAAKAAYIMVYGFIGLVGGSFATLVLASPIPLFVAPAVGVFMGFIEPDARLETAAKGRQDRMTIELAFVAGELYSLVRTRLSLEAAVRTVISRPGGGPLKEELARAYRVYEITQQLTQGLDSMKDRNTNLSVQDFATSLIMVLGPTGGDVATSLDTLSRQAREAMTRYVRLRSNRNERAVANQVSLFLSIMLLAGVLLPIALVVAQSLGG